MPKGFKRYPTKALQSSLFAEPVDETNEAFVTYLSKPPIRGKILTAKLLHPNQIKRRNDLLDKIQRSSTSYAEAEHKEELEKIKARYAETRFRVLAWEYEKSKKKYLTLLSLV